jgi:hypothetical protein
MDASDTIRKNKSRAIYVNQYAAFVAYNGGGDCSRLSTSCCYTASSCIKNFPSFENKYDYYYGMNVCVSTCTSAGPIPVNGGSK